MKVNDYRSLLKDNIEKKFRDFRLRLFNKNDNKLKDYSLKFSGNNACYIRVEDLYYSALSIEIREEIKNDIVNPYGFIVNISDYCKCNEKYININNAFYSAIKIVANRYGYKLEDAHTILNLLKLNIKCSCIDKSTYTKCEKHILNVIEEIFKEVERQMEKEEQERQEIEEEFKEVERQMEKEFKEQVEGKVKKGIKVEELIEKLKEMNGNAEVVCLSEDGYFNIIDVEEEYSDLVSIGIVKE